ncbi:MAG TPA: glyoxalase superfamily protein [Ktedonobacterales bacterium]|nr:glyoxalase superfamily protein [Ktedonobacterales bacterium]
MAAEKVMMVQVAVSDMATAKAFYAEQLGFAVTKDFGQGDHHWVSLELPGGGATLTLTTAHENMQPGTLKLYLATPNVAEAHDGLKARGAAVADLQDDLYGPGSGVQWFEISDPDGNRWLVVQS